MTELRAYPKKVQVGGKRERKPPKGMKRVKMRCYNAKRKGRAFGAKTRNPVRLAWVHQFPCAPCQLEGVMQATRTEAEHWPELGHGGTDDDTYPTCGAHRRMRHEQPVAFARMLRRHRTSGPGLVRHYQRLYEREMYPCP